MGFAMTISMIQKSHFNLQMKRVQRPSWQLFLPPDQIMCGMLKYAAMFNNTSEGSNPKAALRPTTTTHTEKAMKC